MPPPLALHQPITGIVVGIADVERDQSMTTGPQYPSKLAVRSLSILIVEVNDHVQTDNRGHRLGSNRKGLSDLLRMLAHDGSAMPRTSSPLKDRPLQRQHLRRCAWSCPLQTALQ